MDVEECLIKSGDLSYKSGYELTREMVKNDKATALFFASDLMAIGGLKVLTEEKVKILRKLP